MTWRNMQIEEEVRPWQITNSSTLYMFFYSSPFHISFHEGLSGFTELPNLVYFMPKICLTNSCREPFLLWLWAQKCSAEFYFSLFNEFCPFASSFSLILLNYVLESPFLMQTSLVSGWILVRHGSCFIQLICLWTAHNCPCGSRSLPPLVTSLVLMAKDSTSFCGFKRFFKLYQNEHDSVKETREQGRKPCNIDPKISVKTLFHYPPTFPFI